MASSNLSEKRVRGPNFQKCEVLKLEELVRDNFDIINSKFTNKVMNRLKAEAWTRIAEEVSALGFAKRTRDEVQNKWTNMKRSAKEATTKEGLERRKTGGGEVHDKPSEQQHRIQELFLDSASFNGIVGGLDSDERDSLHYFSNIEQPIHVPAATSATVTSAPTTEPDTPQVAASFSAPKTIQINCPDPKKRGIKRTRHGVLLDYQIEYFKGKVERQTLKKELMEVKLRILKKAEEKMEEMRTAELLKILCEE